MEVSAISGPSTRTIQPLSTQRTLEVATSNQQLVTPQSTVIDSHTLTTADSDRIWSATLVQKKEELATLIRLLERKRKRKYGPSSIHVITPEEAIEHCDLESFQHAVGTLAKQFAERKVSTLFTKYLFPKLDHIRFFSQGISSVAQYDGTGSLIWGLLFIVIQCGCIFSESVEEIIAQLAALQDLLPYLQKDLRMYSGSRAVEQSLQVIFEDYIEFCLEIIRHLAKHPLWVFVRTLFSSSLRQTLTRLKSKLERDVAEFDRAVKGAERARAKQADDTIMDSQSHLIQVIAAQQRLHPYQQAVMYQQAQSLQRPSNLLTGTDGAQNPRFPIHSVNIAENPDFFGRESELKTLYELLVESHTQARPLSCTIHGIGGMGKTETALKFTYMYGNKFDALFWVSADPEQQTETLRTFCNIGGRLGLFNSDIVQDTQVEIVLDWLQNEERRWLIVFDNVVERKDIARYWPIKSRKSSAIIVTSQKITPWANHQLELEPLDDQEGSRFLLQQMHISQLDDKDPTWDIAGKISKELGGSPLYLTHAQGLMSLSGCTPEDYLGIIATSNNFLGSKSSSTWRYGKAVSTTHDKIIQELSLGAKNLLYMLSFMSPHEIKEDLILIDHKFDDLRFLCERAKYLQYIAELGEGRLVRRDSVGSQYRLRIHRATQAAMLQKLNENPKERAESFNRVIRLVRGNFADPSMFAKLQIAEAHVWPSITKVLPHLLSAFNCFEKSWPDMKGDLFFAQLLYDIAGMDLYDRGRITETYKINKMVVEILKSLGGSNETRLMADSLAMIGLCSDFMALSKRHEGLQLRKRCIEIRQHCYAQITPGQITPEDKIWLYNGYTDLVCSLQQINDFEGARKHLEECFKQYKLWGPEDSIPYEYSKYYNQMAYVLLYENNGSEAVEFSKKGYELVELATPGAQNVTLYKFDYANILFQHGDADGALEMLRELLKLCKLECGKDNIRTLEIRLNLGIISYFQNDLNDAEKQIRKALSMNNRDLWPIENVVRGKYYLSQVLKAQDPHNEEASKLETEARVGLEKLLELDSSGKTAEYRGNLPILFDYLVHWECRLVTPRKDDQDRGEPEQNTSAMLQALPAIPTTLGRSIHNRVEPRLSNGNPMANAVPSS